jgi:hypothetical protein
VEVIGSSVVASLLSNDFNRESGGDVVLLRLLRVAFMRYAWSAFQLAIIIGVGYSNIHWRWTPNPYLVSLIGIGAAWLCTRVIVALLVTVDRASQRVKARRSPERGAKDQARVAARPVARLTAPTASDF